MMPDMPGAISHLQRALSIYDRAHTDKQTIEAMGGVLAAARATVTAHHADAADARGEY